VAAPASATEWTRCADPGEAVEVALLQGTIDAFAAVAATMRHGEEHWVTDPAYGEGTPFSIGQGFADETGMRVDFFDEIVNERLAELRLYRAEEGGETVTAGVLRIIGQGVWPVICDAG
jgi:hypothetical protein